MTRTRIWIIFLTVVFSSGRAAAQVDAALEQPRVGDRGHLTISAERLFGFDHTSMSTSMNGMQLGSSSSTTISAFGNPGAGLFTPASFPRLALDVFVTRGLSVGAALGVFHDSTSGGGEETTTTGFEVRPRIGYLARIAPKLSVWPRAGIAYQHSSSDSSSANFPGSSGSFDGLIASVEAPLVLTVVPRAAITFGPTFDYSLGGRGTSSSGATSSTTDDKLTAVGVQFGLLVLL